MSYVALYRKFRPPVFEDVKGQDHIITTLKNQIRSDRVGHAYLFCGTRGTGKTSVVKILAKAVNCGNPVDGSPCGECPSCRAIGADASLNVVEMDAASNNGVDDIRNIIDQVAYSPTQGKYRVYIIDEVHMLSTAAFNALGRIGYSTISDKMKDRNTVYKIIFTSCIAITLAALVPFAISNGQKSVIYGAIVVLLLVIVNLGYGGGFSTLPALLSSRFGMEKISKIHGLSLSAWAVAGLTGNNMSAIILKHTGEKYDYILFATLALYAAALVICITMVKPKKNA